ncbi:hypothetical protein PO883_32650 [Massilia sp. DJPM01]|uniref:hypothetical protein n=1 Tax=Massilia sp. DJPM01 TaxID=3024404 RepID=UPI00259E8BDD|nr:hypothetical protein [Massilia sp. DJPM01]MDM5181926.1 hypothetical protein [Massilia sp. DJPM01]
MKIPGKLYVPPKWKSLDPRIRKRFQQVQNLLCGALNQQQPTYEQLSHFAFSPRKEVIVRSSIADMVRCRARRSLSMTQEIACFQKIMREGIVSPSDSLYEAGAKIRYLFFGKHEPLRTFNMAIAWHDWMVISPPMPEDPVFSSLSSCNDGPAIYNELNLYLILLTSHPYTDGNGRAARLIFNFSLTAVCAEPLHYIPLAELTIATSGAYEECLGAACQYGDFRKLIALLLDLLESYFEFLKIRNLEESDSDLARVLDLVKRVRGGTLRSGINNFPPYLISVSNIMECKEKVSVNDGFLKYLLQIAQALSDYCSIDFALTSLADLTDDASPKIGAISFFVKAHRKEELLLHFRQLRAKFRGSIILQVVVASTNPADDAKLLVALMSQFSMSGSDVSRCPVLLHNFDPVCFIDP